MAEKEERIWIGTTEKKIQLKQMTRKEAIERIIKAIAIKYFEGVFSCENEEIEEYAEAALNALLEEK